MIENQSGVYKVTNILTGEFYIGSSIRIKNRWSSQLSEQKHQRKFSCPLLYAAMSEYGIENFKVEIIEECEPVKAVLFEREQYYLDLLKPAYNKVLSAKGVQPDWNGAHHTKEAKANMSKVHKELRAKAKEERGGWVSPEGIEIAKEKRNAHFTPERRQQYCEETTRARDMAEKARKDAADKVAQEFLPMILELQQAGLGLRAIANQMN
jgi:group I intron endonuclease